MNIWGYTFMAITIMVFMQFAGFPTGLDSVFDFMGVDFAEDNSITGFQVTISNLWEYIFNLNFGLLATIGGFGVAAGLVVVGRPDIAINAGIASAVLFLFLPSIAFPIVYALENNFAIWTTALLAMIFIPLTVGYLIALFKYISTGN